MDFRQLESFVEIAKRNSFTKAAEALYLAQPTLTGHIQTLENRLGIALFNRTGKQVTLTEAGELFYNHAVNILNMREQAYYSLGLYQGRLEGELAIGASTVLQNYLLPKLLTEFNKKHPDITFELRRFDSGEVIAAIIAGSMDFGFVGAGTAYPELEMTRLCADELILITSPKEFLASRGETQVTWEQIKDKKFILRERGSATRELLRSALEKKGIAFKDLNIVARIESPNTIKQCVRQGLGVAVLSRRVVQEEIDGGLLRGFTLVDLDLFRDFYFLNHKKRVLDPISRAFKDFTRQYFNEA